MSKNEQKINVEVTKISRFLTTGHGILPSCGCNAPETMRNASLFFKKPQQLTKFT